MGLLKRVYFDVSETTFSRCLSRANDEGMVDKDGRVDIGKLFDGIANAWGNGTWYALRQKRKNTLSVSTMLERARRGTSRPLDVGTGR